MQIAFQIIDRLCSAISINYLNDTYIKRYCTFALSQIVCLFHMNTPNYNIFFCFSIVPKHMLYEMLVYIFLLLVQAGSLFYSHIANKNVLLKAFPAG